MMGLDIHKTVYLNMGLYNYIFRKILRKIMLLFEILSRLDKLHQIFLQQLSQWHFSERAT